jgi:hypothetical protein
MQPGGNECRRAHAVAPPPGRKTRLHRPAGQRETVFPLLRISDTEATFENQQHDFPQRVVYARDGESRLRARIEGMRNGALQVSEFPMSRVSCDSRINSPAKQGVPPRA